MTAQTMIGKAAFGAGLAAMVLTTLAAIPSSASAQSYDPPSSYDSNGYYYNPCQRSTNTRATGGGLAGAALGAAIGSNVAGRHVRTEGAVLGGLLGAVVGSQIGKSTAACDPSSGAAPPPPRQTYYQPAPPPPPPPYPSSYDGDRYGYDYDRNYVSQPVARRPVGDGCQLVESPIYMPDGTTQKRFVRVCPDSTGRYQVVQ